MGRITLEEMEKYLAEKKRMMTPKEEALQEQEKSQSILDVFDVEKDLKPTSKNFAKKIEKLKDNVNSTILSINEGKTEEVANGLIFIIYLAANILKTYEVDYQKIWENKIKNEKHKNINYGKLKNIFGDK